MDNNVKQRLIELKEKRDIVTHEMNLLKSKYKIKGKSNGKSNTLVRVSNLFDEELEDIINKRIENGFDLQPLSKPKITELIVKHKTLWPGLKDDILNFINEKNEK